MLDLNMISMLQGWRPIAIVVYIDGSIVKHKIPVKPINVKGDGA